MARVKPSKKAKPMAAAKPRSIPKVQRAERSFSVGNLFSFLFDFRALRWSGRLSRNDNLYHYGRATLGQLALGFTILLGGFLISEKLMSAMLGLIVLALIVPAWIYLAYTCVKLTVMRLHDFNLSAWWLLAILPLMVVDGVLNNMFPGLTYFVGTVQVASLWLLLVPADGKPNDYGSVDDYGVVDPSRFVMAVPIVMWLISWLGMLAVMLTMPDLIIQ